MGKELGRNINGLMEDIFPHLFGATEKKHGNLQSL
jgi:hypothetical protein